MWSKLWSIESVVCVFFEMLISFLPLLDVDCNSSFFISFRAWNQYEEANSSPDTKQKKAILKMNSNLSKNLEIKFPRFCVRNGSFGFEFSKHQEVSRSKILNEQFLNKLSVIFVGKVLREHGKIRDFMYDWEPMRWAFCKFHWIKTNIEARIDAEEF